MTKLTNPNVKNLIKTITKDVAAALDKRLFYDTPEQDEVRKDAASELLMSLNALKAKDGIKDFNVGRCYISTWETLYPNMFMRHLAIESYAAHGNVIYTTDDPGFPYVRKEVYWLIDAVGRRYFLETNDIEPREGETIEIVVFYEMALPGEMVFEVYVKPVQPVAMFSIEAVVGAFP